MIRLKTGARTLLFILIITMPVTVYAKGLVLVAGATGGTGREVVAQLLEKGYTVRAMVRSLDKGKQVLGAEIPLIEADVTEPDTLTNAVQGVDYVVNTVGAGLKGKGKTSPEAVDYTGSLALINAAQTAGVKKFVLTTSGGVTWWIHPLNWFGGNVLKWKRKAEQYLRSTGMTHVIVRPAGGLTDEPTNSRAVVLSQSDGIPSSVCRADVATAIVAALENSDADNKTFEIRDSDKGKPVGEIDWQQAFAAMQINSDNH